MKHRRNSKESNTDDVEEANDLTSMEESAYKLKYVYY